MSCETVKERKEAGERGETDFVVIIMFFFISVIHFSYHETESKSKKKKSVKLVKMTFSYVTEYDDQKLFSSLKMTTRWLSLLCVREAETHFLESRLTSVLNAHTLSSLLCNLRCTQKGNDNDFRCVSALVHTYLHKWWAVAHSSILECLWVLERKSEERRRTRRWRTGLRVGRHRIVVNANYTTKKNHHHNHHWKNGRGKSPSEIRHILFSLPYFLQRQFAFAHSLPFSVFESVISNLRQR